MNENNNHNIADINILKEVETSFLDYSMSVIVSRALPDLRDGLKPVHRRIIYAMTKLHILSNTPYKKSARIVGEVIGKYHPHGDTSVYEAMVKIAQTFNYLHPLVDGQGNFGSIDGDSPAAMRYTEARLQKITNLFINDLDKNTVPFIENYDNSEKEPLFLPCSFPNLLVNGSYGIAVGLATNIPPHNLGEVIDAVIALVKNPNLNTRQLMDYIKGPDFPTNAIVSTGKGLYDAYDKGLGAVKIRAKTEIIKIGNKKQIIITEIPYRLNKSKLLEKIAELITKKHFTDIVDLRDESNRKGVKIVIELKKHSQEKVTLNKLLKLTPLQSSVNFNMVALDNNQPKLLSLKQILQSFINHYILVIVKRSKFEHTNCVKRLHILDGLSITLDNIDFVVAILKASKNPKEASLKLQDQFKFSNEQVKAILEMKMQKLTNLEKDKIKKEIEQLKNNIKKLEEIIQNKDKQLNILVKEQMDIKNKFAKPRKTELILEDIDIDNEALIKKEDILIVLSKNNYIKRLDADEINTQKRRGKGSRTINKDFIIDKVISSSTLDDILFFTDKGNIFKLRAYTINKYSSNSSKGLPIINLLPNLTKNEKIKTMIAVSKEDYKNKNILFFTKNGAAKKTDLGLFIRNRNTSMIGIKIKEDDELINVSLIDKTKNNNPTILAASKKGKIVNVSTEKLRLSGKTARPLPFINLEKNDHLIAGCSIDKTKEVILISENGIGKIINSKLRETSRNSKGVKGITLTSTSGKLQYIKEIHENEDLIIVSKKGFIIRIDINNLPSASRTSQGNYLIRLEDNDKVKLLETLKVDKK